MKIQKMNIYIHYSLKQFFHTTGICLLQCYWFLSKNLLSKKIHTHIIQSPKKLVNFSYYILSNFTTALNLALTVPTVMLYLLPTVIMLSCRRETMWFSPKELFFLSLSNTVFYKLCHKGNNANKNIKACQEYYTIQKTILMYSLQWRLTLYLYLRHLNNFVTFQLSHCVCSNSGFRVWDGKSSWVC